MIVDAYAASLTMDEQENVRLHFRQALPWKGVVRLKDNQCRVRMKVLVDCRADGAVGSAAAHHPLLSPLAAPSAAKPGDAILSSEFLEPRESLLSSLPPLAPGICAGCGFDCGAGCVPTGASADAAPEVGSPAATAPASAFRYRARRVFFGRDVGSTGRQLMDVLALAKRPYLGPTSLEPELALIMANIGRVGRHDLVYDPFVGTGSIVAAAARLTGCTVFGSDIDFKILAGRNGRDAFTNFEHYGMARPELMYLDNAHAQLSRRPIIDVILADPPYGVRAGARKGGRSAEKDKDASSTAGVASSAVSSSSEISAAAVDSSLVVAADPAVAAADLGAGAGAGAEGSGDSATRSQNSATDEAAKLSLRTGRVYSRNVWLTQPYEEWDVMYDLLDRAASLLVPGGRVVYLYPTLRDHTSDKLPVHPCLALESDSEQVLSLMLSRRIVCMVKVAHYDPSRKADYRTTARAAAEAAGIVGAAIKQRMGSAYDAWFASNKAALGGADKIAAVRKAAAPVYKPSKYTPKEVRQAQAKIAAVTAGGEGAAAYRAGCEGATAEASKPAISAGGLAAAPAGTDGEAGVSNGGGGGAVMDEDKGSDDGIRDLPAAITGLKRTLREEASRLGLSRRQAKLYCKKLVTQHHRQEKMRRLGHAEGDLPVGTADDDAERDGAESTDSDASSREHASAAAAAGADAEAGEAGAAAAQ
jgi:tRNA G10  N-methylase Trm11